jgi:nucleotidyltransferase/DNA polymerase involved in DNA repair
VTATNGGKMQHIFLHVDLDAFFASVEQLDHPEWRGLPVIVGGKPGDRRSVVSTASYEARKYGVHSGMPTEQAVKLCPKGIFVHGRMKRYHEKSAEVMAVFQEFSPDVLQMSVDEAFIDITGTERLFGKPENTARTLQKTVQAKTGLTVSVGMGTTKYIAKIASGLYKPNGNCFVPPGAEIEFMLSLPLTKVWGIGSKTLEKIHSAGLNTTRDIFNHSEQLLISIFGTATGKFLYNAVRGNEVETFTVDTKSHQLSAENTFPYDLADQDMIETALMDLAHTVSFRMLREKVISHTIAVKIRYEDFTTVNIQETYTHEIVTVEDLFLHAKQLFTRKYENGRGIRLLGIGVQNTESTDLPRQTNLFDFGEEKKQKIQNAILAAESKDPAIKIKKARLLLKEHIPAFIVFFSLLFFFPCNLSADNETTIEASGAGSIIFDTTKIPPLTSQQTVSLFNYSVNDNNIEFRTKGYWQSSITNTSSYSFGFDSTPGYSIGTPVFIQNTDLSLWFLLNHHWYFEAAFADGFNKNTVGAGYYGDGVVKEARVANRNIIFPSTYSIDTVNRNIGGSDNLAPGISVHLQTNSWIADAVIRYDMLQGKEKTWYGKNEVSTDTIALSEWNTGQQYILPSQEATTAVNSIFVESSSGTYTDTQGRSYKKLDSSEYLILPARCEIILSSDAGAEKNGNTLPAVAILFDNAEICTTTGLGLGSYGTNKNPGEDFLGSVQKWFGSDSEKVPNVASYSYGKNGGKSGPAPDATGNETSGFFTKINGLTVLLVQHPAGFSPFTASYRYDCGSTAASDTAIISAATETASTIYISTISDEDTSLVSENFFSSKHTYVDVYHNETSASQATAGLLPAVRFPLADTDPGIYLGYKQTSDLTLAVRTYTAVSRFDIGSEAVSGTIRVYKNGIIDSGATYDSESGTITLSSAVTSGDHIYASWYEESGTSDSGAVAAAAGLAWSPVKNLDADVSFGTRWTYAPNKKFADSAYAAPGFITIATGMELQRDSGLFANTAAVTLENNNTTGYYRILGMDNEKPETIYLTKSAGIDLPDNFVPTLNPRPDSTTTMPELDSNFNGSVSAETGKTDSGISGYAVPVSWNFSTISSGASASEPAWAATAIDLPGTASSLASAATFSIALKNNDSSNKALSVYLQLGVDADEDFSIEDVSTIPTWLISKTSETATNPENVESSFIPGIDYDSTENKNGWQTVTVKLTDSDRARLAAHYDARIIICASDPSSIITGTIYAGPYEADDLAFSTAANDATSVSEHQKTDSSLSDSEIKRFNSGTNYIQQFEWITDTSDISALSSSDTFNLVVTRYFEEVDITPYTTISLWFSYNPDTTTKTVYSGAASIDTDGMTISLDRPQSDGTSKEAVKLVISSACMLKYTGNSWHHLVINRINNTVKIDGSTISNGVSVYTKASVVPVRLQITVNTAETDSYYPAGSFLIDELSLGGSTPHIILQDTASTTWNKNGSVLKKGETTIVKDISMSASGTGSSTIQTSGNNSAEGTLSGNISGEGTITGLKIKADASHTTDTTAIISNAGHMIETASPLFRFFSLTESYRFSNTEESLDKNNSATLDFSSLQLPVIIHASTTSSSSIWALTQTTSAKTIIQTKPCTFTLSSSLFQKLLPSAAEVSTPDTDNYFSGWKDSTALAFSSGYAQAARRAVTTTGTISGALPFYGLKPSYTVSTSGTYKKTTSVLFNDDISELFTIPFYVNKKNALSLSWKKACGGVTSTTAGGNYMRDIDSLTNCMEQKTWYFSSFPFYDLFSTRIAQNVLADTAMTTTSSDSLYYTGTYTASWKRFFSGTKNDLFLPSTASIAIARDIRTSATISDIYQMKTQVGFMALNIFGTKGSYPVISWFQQDEYTTSFSATLKIPHTDIHNTTTVYTGYIQANFYLNKTDTLKTGFEGSYETIRNWSSKATVILKHSGKLSPIISAVQLLYPLPISEKNNIVRTESLNIGISETETASTTKTTIIKKQSVSIAHLVEIMLTKYVSINGSISGSYDCTWDQIVTLSAATSIGCTIKF